MLNIYYKRCRKKYNKYEMDSFDVMFSSLILSLENLCVLCCLLSSFCEVMLTLPAYDSGRNMFLVGLHV